MARTIGQGAIQTSDSDQVLVEVITTPRGLRAWRVRSYRDVRALLTDGRVSRHPDVEHASSSVRPVVFEEFGEGHGHRMRDALSRAFSPGRVRYLRPKIHDLAIWLMDAIERHGPPIDLRTSLSLPMVGLAICELLGIPVSDRVEFIRCARTVGRPDETNRAATDVAKLWTIMQSLINNRRLEKGQDAISEMVDTLPDGEIVGLAAALMFGGYETTAAVIERGVVLLLANRPDIETWHRDSKSLAAAVEEILRVPAPGGDGVRPGVGGLPRYATTDFQLGGVSIHTGDLVLLDIRGANQDPCQFAKPNRFDMRRRRNAHLTFGYGTYYCPGAPLARIVLQEVFWALFDRFPRLHLTAEPERDTDENDAIVSLVAAW